MSVPVSSGSYYLSPNFESRTPAEQGYFSDFLSGKEVSIGLEGRFAHNKSYFSPVFSVLYQKLVVTLVE